MPAHSPTSAHTSTRRARGEEGGTAAALSAAARMNGEGSGRESGTAGAAGTGEEKMLMHLQRDMSKDPKLADMDQALAAALQALSRPPLLLLRPFPYRLPVLAPSPIFFFPRSAVLLPHLCLSMPPASCGTHSPGRSMGYGLEGPS